MTEAAAPPAPEVPAAEAPRTCGLLVASLALTVVSVVLPRAFGPLGPFAAGVLAFLGHRRVRTSGGRLRGPLLAKVAMTAALLLLASWAWFLHAHRHAAAAEVRIRTAVGRVETLLRSGTPEAAWDLLDPEARRGLDRGAFVEDLRAAMGRLGPLETLPTSEEPAGDVEAMRAFDEGDAADLRLRYAFAATFRRGPGRVEMEVRVRRSGPEVAADLVALRVLPGGGGPVR